MLAKPKNITTTSKSCRILHLQTYLPLDCSGAPPPSTRQQSSDTGTLH